MFIRKATVQKLLKKIEAQEQEIDILNEKVGILALSLGKQFELVVEDGYKLTPIPPGHEQFVMAKIKRIHSSESLL